MKMKALLALGLCFALTVTCSAQDKETKELDSVYITPFAGAKIILVGKGMEKLLNENNLEVLKNKFIEDYNESKKDKDFPATAKNIIYLAGQDGRRRLKAVPDDVTPLKIDEEIDAFKNNLPAYHYTIYDLTKDYEYHIYVKQTEDLDSLNSINLSKLIVPDNSNVSVRQNRNAMLALSSHTGILIDPLSKKSKGFGVLAPNIGIGFINNRISPSIGFDLYYYRLNKYGKPNYETGINYTFNMLADYENKKFTNFYPISNYNVYFTKAIGKYGFGLSLGTYSYGNSKLFGSVRKGSLDGARSFGIITQAKDFQMEFKFIFDKQKNTNTALQIRYRF